MSVNAWDSHKQPGGSAQNLNEQGTHHTLDEEDTYPHTTPWPRAVTFVL